LGPFSFGEFVNALNVALSTFGEYLQFGRLVALGKLGSIQSLAASCFIVRIGTNID